VLDWHAARRSPHKEWLAWYSQMLELRMRVIVPRLAGMRSHAGEYRPLSAHALAVAWRLGDGSRLTLLANLGEDPVTLAEPAAGALLYATGDAPKKTLPPWSAAFFLAEIGEG
jgi:1,4-alpha-glucan branching enzyme/maltooligosyltrehalose trehalohydrolase